MTVDTAGPEKSMDKKVRPEPQDVLKLQQAGGASSARLKGWNPSSRKEVATTGSVSFLNFH